MLLRCDPGHPKSIQKPSENALAPGASTLPSRRKLQIALPEPFEHRRCVRKREIYSLFSSPKRRHRCRRSSDSKSGEDVFLQTRFGSVISL